MHLKYGIVIQICLFACLAVACPSRAEILTGNDVQAIVKIAEEFGEAKLVAAPEQDPHIEGKSEGILYTGYFTDCTKNTDCKSLLLRMIYANHGKSISDVNSFNDNTKVGKLYIEAESKYLIFDFFINLEHGVVPNNLKSSFNWFFVGVRDVVKKIQKEPSSENTDANSIGEKLRNRVRN